MSETLLTLPPKAIITGLILCAISLVVLYVFRKANTNRWYVVVAGAVFVGGVTIIMIAGIIMMLILVKLGGK